MKTIIKNYIVQNIIGEDIDIDFDASLFEDGLVDSMGQVKLIAFLEKHFHISIEPGEVTIENFDTINQIALLLEKKLSDKQ